MTLQIHIIEMFDNFLKFRLLDEYLLVGSFSSLEKAVSSFVKTMQIDNICIGDYGLSKGLIDYLDKDTLEKNIEIPFEYSIIDKISENIEYPYITIYQLQKMRLDGINI